MAKSSAEKRAAFRALHESGCFVLPNPWDVGSAAILEHAGFKALATTSAGMAWSLGMTDGAVSVDEVLIHLTRLAHATDLPLNADFENGFADTADGVAANVALAVDTGIAGISVEDWSGRELYPFEVAVERVTAARAAIDRVAPGVVLTGRAEGFLRGAPDLPEVIRRLKAFAAAGADCLYAPGLREEAQVRAIVEAVAPLPVNFLSTGLPVATMAAWGVRRVSLGGALAAVAYGEMMRVADEIAKDGVFTTLVSGAKERKPLNPVFARN